MCRNYRRWAKSVLFFVGLPEFSRLVRARRQDPRTVRAICRVPETILMLKGGKELTRACLPELGAVICAAKIPDPFLGRLW